MFKVYKLWLHQDNLIKLMEEVTQDPISKLEGEVSSRNSEECYLKMLDIVKIPQIVQQMPHQVFLPPEVLGDLEGSILATASDSLERSQSIKWDVKRRLPIGEKVFVGDRDSVSTNPFLNSFLRDKRIVTYHTHGFGILYPSNPDVAINVSLPRRSFINIIGSSRGISALMQTEKATRLPFSAIVKNIQTRLSLEKKGFDFGVSYEEMARILSDYGYAYYGWKPDTEMVEAGSLKNGVTVVKVDF